MASLHILRNSMNPKENKLKSHTELKYNQIPENKRILKATKVTHCEKPQKLEGSEITYLHLILAKKWRSNEIAYLKC